ncbi:MAG: porin [Pseudomonadota bacterium]
MKRITLLAVVLGLCMMMAAPVMALDVEFSGQYRTRGYYIDKQDMGFINGNNIDSSYMDMRFRLQTIFKVNENISVTTRFDALDNKKWGDKLPGYTSAYALQSGTADSSPDDQANVDFDRAYATIKTPIGGFLFGRMKDNSWGTSFSDTEGDGDRLVYVVPVQNWIFAAVYEKWHELDGDPNNRVNVGTYAPAYGSDQDNDKYYLTATYRSEAFTAGMLYGYYKVGNYMDMGDESHYQIIRTTLGAAGYTSLRRPISATAHVFSPYVSGRWGDLEIQAEGTMAFGKVDYKYGQMSDPNGYGTIPVVGTTIIQSMNNNGKTKDLELSNFMIDATYHFGPLALNGGYGQVSGDQKYRSNDTGKATAFGFIEEGGDWHKLWILNGGSRRGDDNGMYQSMGGTYTPLTGGTAESMGNVSNFQNQVSVNGYRAWWIGGDYSIMENLTAGILVGASKADRTIEGWDSNHGTEYDVNVIWDIYENLRWRMTYAYLKAGDYWKQGSSTTQLKDPYTFYTNISVNF